MKKTLLILIIVLVANFTNFLIAAEEVSEDEDIQITKRFLLKYIKVTQLEKDIDEIFKPKDIYSDASKNSLIITDTKSYLEKIEKYIATEDILYPDAINEKDVDKYSLITKVYEVKNVEIDKIFDHINIHLAKDITMSKDVVRNLIVVTGTKSSFDRIDQIVRDMDKIEKRVNTFVCPIKYKDVEEAATIIDSIFKPTYMETDKTDRTIAIRDTDVNIKKIQDFIDKYDKKPKSILVEGILLRVNQEKAAQSGVNYNHEYKYAKDINPATAAEGKNTASSYDINLMPKDIPNVMYEFTTEGGKKFSVSIGALIDSGAAEVVLKPHLVFLSGRFGTFEQSDTIGSNIKLDVEGIAVPTGDNSYNIVLSKMEIDDGKMKAEKVDTNISYKAPQIIANGSVIIVGGAINREKILVESKIPILGEIPFLGELFKSKNEVVNTTESLALLRLKVIEDDEDMKKLGTSFENSKKNMPVDMGGQEKDNTFGHPLNTAEWTSSIIYRNGGGYFEEIDGKISSELQSQALKVFNSEILSRIAADGKWNEREIITKMIRNDKQIYGIVVEKAKTVNMTPKQLIIAARHKGAMDDDLYLVYSDIIRSGK